MIPGFKEQETSRDAAVAVASRAGVLRDRAMNILAKMPGGLTADEVAAFMGESVLAVRPRISELFKAGRVQKSGARRVNESGLSAHVWIAA